jgi:hypothetical protein
VTSGRGGTLGIGIAVVEALTLDQSFTSPSGLFADINECCRFVAQTFTAGLTGTLGGVNIEVRSISVFPLHVAIRTVIDGVPSTTVLGETTLSSSSAPLSLLITFPQVIHITAGVQYAIVVNYEGAPPPGPGQSQGIWSGAIGDSYPGGRGYASFFDGISWFQLAVPDGDLHFQTYVNVVPALDHFKCYEAEGRRVNVRVTLEDQFGVEPRVLVGLPKFFCNPVDKNDEGITNDTAHLTCYEIRGSDKQLTVSIQNQFGEQSLRVQEPRLLCVPSEKISVVPHKDKNNKDDDER